MRLKRRNDPSVRAFWSRHVTLWMRSPYSQREYAERNGISRTLLQRWWVWIREDRAREERIKIARCRRRRFSTMTNATSQRTSDVSTVSPAAMMKELADRPITRRRRFSDEDKRHLLDLAKQPGSSISDVAQRYDLAVSLLFRWRKEFGGNPAPFAGFTPVGSAGAGARWATVSTMVETCKLNGVEPYAYISDVLARMVDGHPAAKLDELLPWNWKAAAVNG